MGNLIPGNAESIAQIQSEFERFVGEPSADTFTAVLRIAHDQELCRPVAGALLTGATFASNGLVFYLVRQEWRGAFYMLLGILLVISGFLTLKKDLEVRREIRRINTLAVATLGTISEQLGGRLPPLLHEDHVRLRHVMRRARLWPENLVKLCHSPEKDENFPDV